MAKKKIKAKKPAPKKKRVATKRKKAKTIAEQIDAFDWRDVKKMFIGGGIIGGETIKRPKK
jgi:hypothetical protein